MRMNEAQALIDGKEFQPAPYEGFMVKFNKNEDGHTREDHFPDRIQGDDLIATVEEAWEVARKFADATDEYMYTNIHVIDESYKPVEGYEEKTIRDMQFIYDRLKRDGKI